jgi:hypothetical protein
MFRKLAFLNPLLDDNKDTGTNKVSVKITLKKLALDILLKDQKSF